MNSLRSNDSVGTRIVSCKTGKGKKKKQARKISAGMTEAQMKLRKESGIGDSTERRLST